MNKKLNYHWDKWAVESTESYAVQISRDGATRTSLAIPYGEVIRFLAGVEEENEKSLKDLAEQIFDTTENMNRDPYPDEDLLLETLCRVRDICRNVLGEEAH